MSNQSEGRKTIKNFEQFEALINSTAGNCKKCDFTFPFNVKSLNAEIKNLSRLHRFHDCTFSNGIILSNVTFQQSLIFDSVSFTGTLKISGCTFQTLEIVSPEVKEIELVGNTFLEKFKLSITEGEQYENIQILYGINGTQHKKALKKACIKKLAFMENKIEKGALIRFGYLNVGKCCISNIRNPIDSEINIGDCNFTKFAILNLRNAGKFRIYRINDEEKKMKYTSLVLQDSSFGDSEFQSVDFSQYERAFVTDCLFTDLKYNRLKWHKDIKTQKTHPDERERETYRILKNVAQQNNDAPQAIEFYAKEMKSYSEVLQNSEGRCLDKIILWFNHLTNKFGLNWFFPILWILALGAVLYVSLLHSLSLDIGDGNNWGEFFVFLIPTHRLEFIGEGCWTYHTYLVDFLFRVIEAPLIYQAIVAFRKFTRKF